MAALLAACGGSSSDANEAAGTFHMQVTEASFPTSQHLGQTTQLKLGVRNTGKKTVPNLVVTVGIVGKAGTDSELPFGVRDPESGLARPDRPVWVLSEHFPKLAGSTTAGGASTANSKTFAFGPLKPGRSTDAVWQLSAVKAGHYTLKYEVGAGLTGAEKAKTGHGVTPGGSFVVDVNSELPETEVTDNGEIVEIEK